MVDQVGRGGEVPQGVGEGEVGLHSADGLDVAPWEGPSYQTWQGRVDQQMIKAGRLVRQTDRLTDRLKEQ